MNDITFQNKTILIERKMTNGIAGVLELIIEKYSDSLPFAFIMVTAIYNLFLIARIKYG